MKIVTAAEMREIDRITTQRFGVPSLTLMENAGTAVADFVTSRYPAAQRIGVICGKGNNGGDGFVAARKLREAGKDVRVLLLAEIRELRGDAAGMCSKLAGSAADGVDNGRFEERSSPCSLPFGHPGRCHPRYRLSSAGKRLVCRSDCRDERELLARSSQSIFHPEPTPTSWEIR